MSLEEKVAALVDAITANTDALQHLATAIRSAQASPPKQVPANQITGAPPEGAPAAEPKPRGRPRTTPPPPSPLAAAQVKRQEPEGNASASTGTQASAPPADSGSEASGEAEGTYADLQQLVPELSEKKGRSAAVALFAKLGFANGKELLAQAPEKVPEAVKMFREALK